MNIPAILNSHIRVLTADLPGAALQDIIQVLTVDNKEKQEALDRNIKGASDMPDFIELFEIEGDEILIPRGSAHNLTEALWLDYEIEFDWDDRRNSTDFGIAGEEIPARPYQQKIIEAVLENQQGIVCAPPGSGKTVAGLAVIDSLGGNALVIVNTKEIADQWLQRSADWLGDDYPVALVGDGSFEISDGITVAIQATLWSRRAELQADGFFNRFRTVCLDECHHVTARTYNEVISKFSSEVRFGMSATPKKTGDFRLAEAVVGPVIVEVTERDVESQVLRPEIHVVTTEFGAVYRGDRKTDHGFRRNNYSSILKKLSEDQRRAQLICDVILNRCMENVNLVLSKRLDHLSLLWDTLVGNGYDRKSIVTIVGMDSRAARREAVKRTEDGPCVILSTLADEALDAPRIDRVHLAWPTRNTDLVSQQIGRGRRKHPDKRNCIIYDYRDLQVKPMESQYMDRRHKLYTPKGWTVKKIKREDI